jgi:deoxyxylulose-5-phosphate synthase
MKISKEVLVLGFEDEFTEHGDPNVLMQQYGLTASGIQKRIDEMWPVAQQATVNLRRVV